MELIDNDEDDKKIVINPIIYGFVKEKWVSSKKSLSNSYIGESLSEDQTSSKLESALLEDQKLGISSFDIIRELGKGAFGKVYLVKI